MGYFTEVELDGIEVSKMIIHVVKHADDAFAPQPQIEVQEEGFFRARIIAEGADGVHSFDPNSPVKSVLEKMAKGDMTFEAGGQNLSQRFYEFHVKQSVGGAFFVLELTTTIPACKFYALIKYDYREAVELTEKAGKSVLRAIVQAFVKERKAVQKICLVRVQGGVADTLVSASDRMKDAPDLTDYFERYLGVSRSRDNTELSKKLNEVLRESLEQIRDHLPGRDVGKAVAAAKLALQGRATVKNEDVLDAVLHAAERPSNEEVRAEIDITLRRQLKRLKLQDVEFTPDPDTLKVMPRRVVRTAEQVRLEFPLEELGNSVIRQDTPDGITFTIHTSRLVEDGTLKEKTR